MRKEAHIEKIAYKALVNYLAKLAPSAQKQVLKSLPPEMASQASYKLLGRKANQAISTMSDAAGHGRGHIRNVTRNVQDLMLDAPNLADRRRGVISALLHDVGREAEGRMKKRLGKAVFKQTPSAAHSELGGRYAEKFLRQNKHLAKRVPGLDQGRLKGAIRAHDTDAHKVMPWTREQLFRDRAAGATYLGDKMEGLGRVGAERTVSMAQKFKELPSETWGIAQKNKDKYRNVIDTFATPEQAVKLNPLLDEYVSQMAHYRDTGALPAIAKTSSVKESMASSIRDFVRAFKRIGADDTHKILVELKKLMLQAPPGHADSLLFNAIYELPFHQREAAFKLMSLLKNIK
jgi:hypothetical protein